MKKLLLILLVLLGCSSLQAQTNAFTPEWGFGANAGATISSMRFGQRKVNQSLFVQYPTGGLTARYISEKHFGLQAELNYSLRGWHENNDSIAYKRSLAYLELPLLTHIYFDLGKRARFILNLGPQIGYNIGEDVKQREFSLTEGTEPEPYYDLKVQHKFDYGIAAGGGLEIRTSIGSFILEGRYYFGLSDIFNNSKADYFQTSSNQVIGIKLTYLMRR